MDTRLIMSQHEFNRVVVEALRWLDRSRFHNEEAARVFHDHLAMLDEYADRAEDGVDATAFVPTIRLNPGTDLRQLMNECDDDA